MPSLLTGKVDKAFSLAPAPHLRAGHSVSWIMWGTFTALFPVLVSSLLFFGWDALRVFLLAVSSAVGFEYLFSVLMKRKVRIRNGSAALLGALLAFLLEPATLWWAVLFGSFVMIVLGREIFGGFGQNIFHPALVGYITLIALFPVETNQDVGVMPMSMGQLFFGTQSDVLGGANSFAISVSAAILLVRKWIRWENPIFYLLALTIGSFVMGRPVASEVLNGSIFLCAFFFVTDWVTAPVTQRGRILFALGAGLLTAFFRSWINPLEAAASSILLMNAVTPLLDRFVRARRG